MADNKKKIAFLDRDGVINKKAKEHQYITKTESFIFNEGIFELLEFLTDTGFEFIIITNQRGVARNMLTENELKKIHSYMIEKLNGNKINILDIFYCPHEINTCDCRKPKPGLIYKAADKYKIDLSNSILISDSENEMEMGKAAGLKYSFLIPVDNPAFLLNELKSNPQKYNL